MEIKKIIIAVAVILGVVGAGIAYILSRDFSHNNEVVIESATDLIYTDITVNESEDVCIYVYVCGKVNNPGVVCLKKDARVYEAIEAAGGMTAEAMADAVNQAKPVNDGDMIYIPGVNEEYTMEEAFGDGLVNINTASKEELMTLPGIGESKADSIIEYRNSSGGFTVIEDIMQISGIKESAFNKIKEYIKV